MYISVEGFRSDPSEWKRVQALRGDELSPLSPAQKEVAMKLRVPEEQYARSALAGERTTEKLLKKVERFASFFQDQIRQKGSPAIIDTIKLDTWTGYFEIKFHNAELPVTSGRNARR
jgi:hypothetical protein